MKITKRQLRRVIKEAMGQAENILQVSYGHGVLYYGNNKQIFPPEDEEGYTPWERDDGGIDVQMLVDWARSQGFTAIAHDQFYEEQSQGHSDENGPFPIPIDQFADEWNKLAAGGF
tara:strand:+ start:3201 stop:3548 length:348 start_codon:yes stop_codon:yes gene_type:complete